MKLKSDELESLLLRTRRPNVTQRSRAPFCEQCGRLTEYLFHGEVAHKATRYSHGPRPKPIGLVDVYREAMVCQRCRPPSNLEIQEILERGKYKGHTLEVRINQ